MVPTTSSNPFSDRDVDLLRRARTLGDAGAFENVVDQHLPRVFNQAYRATGRTDEAEIVTEHAFASLLIEPDAEVPPYVSLGRRVLGESVEPFDDTQPTGPIRAVPAGLKPAADQDDADAAVVAANLQLPVEQRLALAMRELDGAPYQRIGQVLGGDRSAGAAAVGRARVALFSELEPSASAPRWYVGEGRELLPWISAEMDGELDASIRAEAIAQIEGSPDALEAREKLRDVRKVYRAWSSLPVPEGLRERILTSDQVAARLRMQSYAHVERDASDGGLAAASSVDGTAEAIRPRHFALLGGLATAAILGGLLIGRTFLSEEPKRSIQAVAAGGVQTDSPRSATPTTAIAATKPPAPAAAKPKAPAPARKVVATRREQANPPATSGTPRVVPRVVTPVTRTQTRVPVRISPAPRPAPVRAAAPTRALRQATPAVPLPPVPERRAVPTPAPPVAEILPPASTGSVQAPPPPELALP